MIGIDKRLDRESLAIWALGGDDLIEDAIPVGAG